MRVAFKRTGTRRYGVILSGSGLLPQAIDPAPGYDDDIPHDLVHYVVEAELRLAHGVFGRAAQGAGTFIAAPAGAQNARALARLRRKQKRREEGMRSREEHEQQMSTSERLAGLSDVAWRRRHRQEADLTRTPPEPTSPAEAAQVRRIVERLDVLAPLWRALPIGEELVFEWPSLEPRGS